MSPIQLCVMQYTKDRTGVEPTEVHRLHCAALPHTRPLSAVHAEGFNSQALNNEMFRS